MSPVELIARVLCDFDGREPDFVKHGQPAWKRYVSQANMVWYALKDHLGDKSDERPR